jgi:phosphinothricin acetyltransferase
MKPRLATIEDLPAIVDIYNQAIKSGSATGDMTEFMIEERIDWFKFFDSDNYPLYVVELNEKVVGYATISPYRPGREAMKQVAEISFFVDYSHHGKGIGTALINYAISDCNRISKTTLLAILLDINTKSIKLLKKFNFKEWGYLPDIINFNGVKCGHLIYGLGL